MYIRTIPLILTIATSTAYAQEFLIESAERKASSSIYQEFPVDNSAWDSESSQSAGFAISKHTASPISLITHSR